jgi:short-subunit dehydrogenase
MQTEAQKGWAIITGASGGIGAAFAREIARRGYSVLAVANRPGPLGELADQLRRDGGRVEILTADLSTPEGASAVTERARTLGPVELLINNAGLSTSGHFLEQSREREIQSIRVNVEALYRLTRDIVPEMVQRRRGGILNVASVVGFQAVPYWTTYAATKAFVVAFGEGLAYELRNSGVRVVTVCPGFTKTGLYAVSGVPGLAGKLLPYATPEAVVASALAAYDRGRVLSVVGSANRMMRFAGALTPRPALRWFMATLFAPTTKAAVRSTDSDAKGSAKE